MDQIPTAEAGERPTSPLLSEPPQVFGLRCFKCTREYELHGRQSILEALLADEGWIRDGDRMCCPWCPSIRDGEATFNKSKELARNKKRAA